MLGHRTRNFIAVTITVVAVGVFTGCEPAETDAPTTPTGTQSALPPTGKPDTTPTEKAGPAAKGTALAALAALPVKGRAPMTGYDRDQFGTEWSDAAEGFSYSRNGCDTRNDLLARDLQREVVESNGCVVTSGVLAYEPYTGAKNYYFDKHDDEFETDLDAEHLVALGNIWVTGGQQLSEEERTQIANDEINLAMVNPSENRSKGDADAATWLPPNKSFRCSYVARQIRVKAKYGLWVTAPEKAAMETVLATCPNEPLEQSEVQAGYTVTGDAVPVTPAPTPDATSGPVNPAGGGGEGEDVYYANCDAVRAAGAAPIRVGDPGYSRTLDGDGDGSACE